MRYHRQGGSKVGGMVIGGKQGGCGCGCGCGRNDRARRRRRLKR